MKIQCSCGAKYQFDIAPAMVNNPVRFVCPACGVDASEFVDSLVRRELGQTATPAGVPQPILGPAPSTAKLAPAPAAPQPAPAPVPAPAPAATFNPQPASPSHPVCPKHPGQVAAQKCYICSKPICPKCMELFGYVCSPLCRAKAEARGINIPVFQGQKSVIEARFWRKMGRVGAAIGAVLALLLGVWFWYAWFGSEPKPVFSVRFNAPAYSGESFICGKNQIVFLHGATLARYDLKSGKAVWSRELLHPKDFTERATAWLKEMETQYAQSDSTYKLRPPPLEKLVERVARMAAAGLELHVSGQNIWVVSPDKLTRYDWDTGNPLKELPVGSDQGRLIVRGDELMLVDTDKGLPSLTTVNLATCELQSGNPSQMAKLSGASTNSTTAGAGAREMAGLPTGMPGRDAGKPMDPAQVAEQAQRLSYPARLALPATLAVNANQERALAEMNSDNGRPAQAAAPPQPAATEESSLVPDRDGFIQCSVRLLESRMVARTAMKARPTKSALDHLTAGNTTDAANEILNDMQRDRGGDRVLEDESRYQVTLRQPGQSQGWTGEVVGPPSLYPLETVNVLAANKLILVFDKSCHKLWQSSLSYNVHGGLGALEPGAAPNGQGPCVEHGDSLYVFDQGVLTAFDLHNGNARWRLPSVGITGLFFGQQGMIYVNTTTADPDTIKYSRQIDISQKAEQVVIKVAPKDGRILWDVEPGGFLNYVSGKFLYTVAFYQPEESDDDNPYGGGEVINRPAFLRIRRISPKDGHILWEHDQPRAPLDVQFDKNTIRLVFRKEVQVLHYLRF